MRLCSFSLAPGPAHWAAALKVLGYLHKTRHLGITYGGKLRMPMGLETLPARFHENHGLHNSSCGTSPQPYGGYLIMLANGAIEWKASKSKIPADSTAYAETVVAAKAANATVATRQLLSDLGLWRRSARRR